MLLCLKAEGERKRERKRKRERERESEREREKERILKKKIFGSGLLNHETFPLDNINS